MQVIGITFAMIVAFDNPKKQNAIAGLINMTGYYNCNCNCNCREKDNNDGDHNLILCYQLNVI